MQTDATKVTKSDYPVTGMSCAGCAVSVQQILEDLQGVTAADVNYANATARVQHDASTTTAELQGALEAVGFGLIIDVEDPLTAQQSIEEQAYQVLKRDTIWAGLLTLPIFLIGMFAMDWPAGKWISLFVSIPVLFWLAGTFMSEPIVKPSTVAPTWIPS